MTQLCAAVHVEASRPHFEAVGIHDDHWRCGERCIPSAPGGLALRRLGISPPSLQLPLVPFGEPTLVAELRRSSAPLWNRRRRCRRCVRQGRRCRRCVRQGRRRRRRHRCRRFGGVAAGGVADTAAFETNDDDNAPGSSMSTAGPSTSSDSSPHAARASSLPSLARTVVTGFVATSTCVADATWAALAALSRSPPRMAIDSRIPTDPSPTANPPPPAAFSALPPLCEGGLALCGHSSSSMMRSTSRSSST